MEKRIRDYVKYTRRELDSYTQLDAACVKRINTIIHLNVSPYVLADIRNSIRNILFTKKIGHYDAKMNGVVLEITDIKLLGDLGSIRFDDSKIHFNIEANCFIFQPHVGAIVKGTVRHISTGQIGVILYRVFSVSIRLAERSRPNVEMNSEITFRIKRFNFQNSFSYIEGELIQSNENQETLSVGENVQGTDEHSNEEILKVISKIKTESESAGDIEEHTVPKDQKNRKKRKRTSIKKNSQ